MRFETQDVPIERQRGIELRHGDTDMRDAGAISHAIPPAR
jgi:hypothetical protein